MNVTQYTWDDSKAIQNKRKHGVDFDTAALVFFDQGRIERYDAAHSRHEDRWRTIGLARGKILFVVYTVRVENVIRIISARKADKDERREYYQANS